MSASPQQPVPTCSNLFEAITHCDPDALEQLLAAGADPDEIDIHGHASTPLAWACAHGDECAVRILLGAGAHPDVAAFAPPIVEATRHGFTDLVALLAQAGATIDRADETGATALSIAAASGFSAIARDLVAAGADPRLADLDGQSPADAARASGHALLADWLDEPASVSPRHRLWRDGRDAARRVAEARREHVVDQVLGAAPAQSESEWTFSGGIAKGPWATQDFPSVAASGDLVLVTRMLDAGLDPDWTLFDGGSTALMLASRSGHAEIVDLLLSRGADPNRRCDKGHTALHFALFKPSARVHGPVVTRLLAAAATPDAVDGDGQCPLRRAIAHGMADIAASLIEAGADPFRPDHTGRTPADAAPTSGRQAAAIRTLLDDRRTKSNPP